MNKTHLSVCFIIIFSLLSHTAAATNGIVVYVNASVSNVTPQYRLWNGTDISAQKNATGLSFGTLEWLKVVTSPTRDEAILGSLDASGDIIFAVYNGTADTWGNTMNATRIGTVHDDKRAFDIAYENSTGRALIIFRNGTGGAGAEIEGYYRIWDGTTWSANASLATDSCVGGPSWIRAEPVPNSSHIVMAYYNFTTKGICGQVWNGNAWGNATLFTATGEATTPKQIFDIAPEGLTGRVMVAWAEDSGTTANVTFWNRTAWNHTGRIPAGGLTLAATIQWISLGSDAVSNRIVYAHVDGGLDLDVFHWNGTRWGTGSEPDSAIETLTPKDIEAGFANGTGNTFDSDGYVLYGTGTAADTDFQSVRCLTNMTCQAGTWTVLTVSVGCSANVNWVDMVQDPYNSSRAMAVTISQAGTNNTCIRPFNNSDWSATIPIGNGPNSTESAFFAYQRVVPRLAANASFGNSGNVTFKLTGESFIFNGTCTSIRATSNNVVLKVFDNRTGSLTASTTDSTAIVYINTSSYTNITVKNNEVFGGSFNVTTNNTALNLTIVAECTSSDAGGFNATNSTANIYRSYGFLNATNIKPEANTSFNVGQNGTFNLNATVTCLSNVSNPVAYCGFVNATAVFNGTNLVIPDSRIRATGTGGGITNASGSNTTVNPFACGSLSAQGPGSSSLCSVNWTLNASGTIDGRWYVAVNFTSNGTNVLGNRTNSTQINITSGAVATDISFLLFVPSNNATGTQSYAATNTTQQIIFNYTALGIIRANASVSSGTAQGEGISIFRYRNTGNTAVNITMNFTDNVTGRPEASSVVIKAGWAENAWQDSCAAVNLSYPNTTCANITVNFTGNQAPVRIANLSTTGDAGGKDRDIWLWADWNNMAAAFDRTTTLRHESVQG